MKHTRGTRRRRLQDTVETLAFLGFVALLWRAAQGCPWPFLRSAGAGAVVAAGPVARPLRLTFLPPDRVRAWDIDASDVFGEPILPGTLPLPNPLSTIRPPATDTLPALEELALVPSSGPADEAENPGPTQQSSEP